MNLHQLQAQNPTIGSTYLHITDRQEVRLGMLLGRPNSLVLLTPLLGPRYKHQLELLPQTQEQD